MTPFANRAFEASLLAENDRLRLPINDTADGSTMHGFGWQHAWEIVATSPDKTELRHVYERSDPYAYEARLSMALRPGQAHFELSVLNIGEHPLPFGIGLHPWFPRSATTRLQMRAAASLRLGPRYRATGFGPLEEADNYGEGQPVPSETAVSFIDWDGVAMLTYPETGLSLTISASETMRHPVLWTPANAPFVCLEPQSHAIGAPSEAIVRKATPMAMLKPGENLSGWIALEPRLIQA